jgi:protein tyrosine/serine phosphatase
MRVRAQALRAYATSAVLAVLLSMPAFAQPGHSDTLSTIHINNFGAVNATYYRGAQPKGEDFADLAALGVKTIIDFQEYGDPTEQASVERLGMKFVRIGMNTRIVPTAEQLTHFLSIVNDPASQPVYVHCAGGRHRTGVMTAVYRMTKDGWNGKQAFAEMKKYNFGADFLHPEFKQFVLGYQVPAGPIPNPLAAAQAVADAITAR